MPKVKGTKVTITCFGPVFIGLKNGISYTMKLGASPQLAHWPALAYAPVGERDFPGISCYCRNILEAAPT